jgi:hypothetical protein
MVLIRHFAPNIKSSQSSFTKKCFVQSAFFPVVYTHPRHFFIRFSASQHLLTYPTMSRFCFNAVHAHAATFHEESTVYTSASTAGGLMDMNGADQPAAKGGVTFRKSGNFKPFQLLRSEIMPQPP